MWTKIFTWFHQIGRLISPVSPPDPPLLHELWRAQGHLRCLENHLNHVSPEMTDYVIFQINAAERLCAALWQAARKDKLTVWEDLPNPVFKVVCS